MLPGVLSSSSHVAQGRCMTVNRMTGMRKGETKSCRWCTISPPRENASPPTHMGRPVHHEHLLQTFEYARSCRRIGILIHTRNLPVRFLVRNLTLFHWWFVSSHLRFSDPILTEPGRAEPPPNYSTSNCRRDKLSQDAQVRVVCIR